MGISPLKLGGELLEQALDLAGDLAQLGVFDGLHRGDGIDSGNLDGAVGVLLHDNVARQHSADMALVLQRPVGEVGVARTEVRVGAEIDVDLLFQGVLHVDGGEHAEALGFQHLGGSFDRRIEGQINGLGEMVAHGLPRVGGGRPAFDARAGLAR